MEIAQDLNIPSITDMKSNMYPALVNGLSVREMVRMGEKMLINKNNTPTDQNIF
jgi:hypothetical protein